MVSLKLIRRLSAFLLAFGLLSWSIAAISAAVLSDEADDGAVEAAPAVTAAASEYTPRLTAPSYSNPYYYSDKNVFYEYGWGMPNCTCYAWGRAYELLGYEPKLCVYSAHLWYDYNLEHGYYPCGTEPRLGAIACWRYSNANSGHVAVVEKIENGQITFSNSAYSGTEFYTNTVPVSDPSGGRQTWIFQGYIYIGSFAASGAVQADKPADNSDGEPAQGVLYRITSGTGVNLRSGAGTNNAVLGCLYYDQKVVVSDTKTSGGYTWGYTETGGMKGWFVLKYAEKLGDTDDEPDDTNVSLTAPSASDDMMTGDVDSDGEITILDATHIQRILANLITPTDYMLAVGDYDHDGSFTILDANRIQRFLVNLS